MITLYLRVLMIYGSKGDIRFGNSSSDNFDLKRAGMGGSDLPDLKAEFSDAVKGEHSNG